MSGQNIQGVDLAVGKLSLPISLASVSGPNKFGETLSLQYSTNGLLQEIKTWNEEAQTSEVGLGWSLSQQYIMRSGNGSLDDSFILNGEQTLTLQSKTQDPNTGIYTLVFVTAQQSLSKIVYETIPNDPSSPEKWTIVDANGVTYTYGGNSAAISWGVRWIAPTTGLNGQPLVWIGDSTATDNQRHYALAWYLSSKENIYGQTVAYDYFSVTYNVGENGAGLHYTVATYLQGIRVVNGSSITLNYADKNTWETPALRIVYPSSGGITNAYQDRLATKYLHSVSIYNAQGNLQSVVELDYDFLFMHSGLTAGTTLNSMQKRVLTSISYLTPDGKKVGPAQLFDYWGLNDQAQGLNITDTNLLTLIDSDLSGTFTYTDSYQQPHVYTVLFGHLKTQTGSQGAVTWYSYREVSANYDAVSWPTSQWNNTFSYAWSDNWQNRLDLDAIAKPDETNYSWQNRLDLDAIAKPDETNYSWQNPFVYWGADNYAVIRWDSTDGTQIALKVFEWFGFWVEVQISNENMHFVVNSTDIDSVKLITGQGKFILCRLGIKGSSTEGLITLFHRDPYLPGLWHSTYQLSDSSDEFQIVENNSLSTSYQQLEINIGTNIAAILDKQGEKLYLYSLVNNQWSAYPSGVISVSSCPGVVIQGDEVFVITAQCTSQVEGAYTYQLGYTIYKFDLTQAADNAWQSSTGTYKSGSLQYFAELEGINIGFMESGIFLVQILAHTSYSTAEYTIFPMALSWNTDSANSSEWPVNLQEIYYDNGGNETGWGFGAESAGLLWKPTYYGSISASNLINIIPEDAGDYELYRNVTRYAGGSTSIANTNQNLGWIGDTGFAMLTDNSDSWPQVAVFDNVIENAGTGDSRTYNFYQYTAYGNSTTSGHPYWTVQSDVGTAMGTFEDWERIDTTVGEIFGLAGVLIKGVFRWLPGGRIVIATYNKLTRMAKRELKKISQKAMSGRSGSIVQGMNYLMIGQGGIDKYNNLTGIDGDDAPVLSDYDIYQPSAFAKVWDTQNACWTWRSLGSTLTGLAQKNANITWGWQYGSGEKNEGGYDNFIIPFLGQEVYTYSNSFIPFSYIMYGGREVDRPNIRDSFYRALYFDQVAFFQNGTVCCSQLLPTWNTDSKTFPQRTYDSVPLPYVIYTGADTNPPMMFAPWGGVFAYQPESLDLQYEPGSNQTVDWAWESNHVGQDISDDPATPQLSLASNVILTMALNNAVKGSVTDYVVSQIAVDDGYQTYNTFFQYMPWFAAGQADGSIIYNQVRTAGGGTDYAAAALANGWSEYYFYNGGIHYQGSLVNSSTMPYDPACSSDSFSQVNQVLVNTGEYYNLMTESLYCQRTLMSQGSGDFSQGYEVARKQTFYQGFENYVSADSSNLTTQQQVTGLLPTLTVSYSAPANTNIADITDAYTQGAATLQSSYYFYDIAYTDRNNQPQNLYGPLSPADPMTPYQLGLNSGLALGKLQFNYHQTETQGALAIEAGYTQTIPGFYVPQLDNTASAYQRFSELNLYNINVQTISWYHPDLSTATNAGKSVNFATPDTAWGTPNSQNWQIVASQITAWKVAQDSQGNDSCWCPVGKYTWQGDLQGNPLTTSFSGTSSAFPWSAPPVNSDNTPWLQQSITPNAVTASGVLLASETATTLPSYTAYDSRLRLPLMKVTNAGLPSTSLAFYTGFESYENMSDWSYSTTALSGNLNMSYSPYSYAGNRSMMIAAETLATYYFTLELPHAVPTHDSWLLSANVMMQTTVADNNLTLAVMIYYENDQSSTVCSQVSPSLNGWVNYTLPFNIANLPGITQLVFTVQANQAANIYIDSFYCVPAQESQFTCSSYDIATLSSFTAVSQDPAFCGRALTDNRGRAIGAVRKVTRSASQSLSTEAATISLNANHLSREGRQNNDSFSQVDPNFALQVVGGANQAIAGYYFDFRDGLNPWMGGSVPANARSLCLDVNQSTTYPIPSNLNWGIAIRAQIQGYIEPVNALTLSANPVVTTPQALALPIPTISDCFHVYGVYSEAGANPGNFYGFDLSFDAGLPSGTNAINESTTVSISNSLAVTSGQQLLTCNSAGDSLFGVFESNSQYTLYRFTEGSSSQKIYQSNAKLYLPLAGRNNTVYFADETTALYGVDVTDCANRPDLAFNPISVVTYTDIVPNATCTMAPVMDANQTNIAWFLTTTSPKALSSQALALGADATGNGTVVDEANVLNFDYDQDFTIECLVQTATGTQQNGLMILISKWNVWLPNGESQPYPYMVRMDTNGHAQGARYDGGANNPIASSTTVINDGNFHHIAFVRQTDTSGQGWLYLYVDGQLESTLLDTITTSTQNDADLILNQQNFASQTPGVQMMELRIWNHARTSGQIHVNMKQQLTGYEGGLVGYWPLNNTSADLSPFKQDMVLAGTYSYSMLASSNQLPAPSSVWVKYDIATDSIAVWAIRSGGVAPKVATIPALSTDGMLFATTPTSLCAYNTQLGYLAKVSINGTPSGPPVAGNQCVLMAVSTGAVSIYDESLNWIMTVNTGLTLNTAPVIHGDKFSVVGQTSSGTWTIQSYTMAGVLVTQPYVLSKAQSSVSIQAFSPNVSSLCVMVDNTTFMRLDFGVPAGTSMSLGDYTVLYTQNNTTSNYQYQLQNNGTVLATVDLSTLNAAMGDWWLMVIESTLYFYADSEQIFAYALTDTSLPSGNFTLSTGSNGGISCRDIVVCLEPTFTMQFSDGGGKVRQTQTLATIAAPQ